MLVLFHNGELEFAFNRINSVETNAYPIPYGIHFAAALPHDLTAVLMIGEPVSRKRVNRYQAFNKEFCKFYKESKLGRANNKCIEFLAHAILHELSLLPFD